MGVIIPLRTTGDRPCDSDYPRIGARVPPAIRKSWWARMSAGQKASLILATIYTGLIIAALMRLPDPHPFLR